MDFDVRIETRVQDDGAAGPYFAIENTVYINKTKIWYFKSDGNTQPEEPDKSLVDSFLDYWYESHLRDIEASHTEKERHKYNEKYPGNLLATTPEDWLDFKDGWMHRLDETLKDVKEHAEHLPEDPYRRLKALCLWIQEDYEEDSFFFDGILL